MATRRRPNAFNWDHQFNKLTKLGQTAETALNRWEKASAISHSLKIGPEEAKAVLNIQLRMDPDMVGIFKLAVKKIWNGARTNLALLFVISIVGEVSPAEWSKAILQRIVETYT